MSNVLPVSVVVTLIKSVLSDLTVTQARFLNVDGQLTKRVLIIKSIIRMHCINNTY